MGFGDVLKFSGKLVAKTSLFVGEAVCNLAEDAVKKGEERGYENKCSKSFEEQRGFWKSGAKKLSEINSKINLFDK